MEPEYISLYRHVMVLYWPWLWWQLRIITRWRIETGRALLIDTDRRGNIHIRAIGDDPRAPRPGVIKAPVSARLALALSEPLPPFVPLSQRTLGSSAAGSGLGLSGPQHTLGTRRFAKTEAPIPDT
ncbi:MAG: hypothetical protein V7651_09195 [Hyphomonas oceanitis]|uniref:hypothetical protein n=1 Tax=Hyphomonas oceanitis TaxID=81033 RepID=UPI00300195E5